MEFLNALVRWVRQRHGAASNRNAGDRWSGSGGYRPAEPLESRTLLSAQAVAPAVAMPSGHPIAAETQPLAQASQCKAATSVADTPVTIPDPRLEREIRLELRKPKGTITRRDMARLRGLDRKSVV